MRHHPRCFVIATLFLLAAGATHADAGRHSNSFRSANGEFKLELGTDEKT